MLTSSQQDSILEATQNRSLKNASKLQKYNIVLDQAINHIQSFDTPQGNEFLESEGLLRKSGSHKQMQEAFSKVLGEAPKDLSGDPGAYPLSSLPDFMNDQHNVVGLIKKGLRDFKIAWSAAAQEEFEDFRQSNIFKDNKDVKKMEFETLIQNLIKKRLHEEAKVLHNLLHLCHRVCQHEASNKMTVSNIGIVIAPSMADFFSNVLALDPTTQGLALPMAMVGEGQQKSIHPQEQLAGGQRRLFEAIKSDYFAKTFSQTNPDIAEKMAKQYEDNKKYPPVVKPVTVFGIQLPLWMSKVIRFFSSSDKPKDKPKVALPVTSTVTVKPELPVTQETTAKGKFSPAVSTPSIKVESIPLPTVDEPSQENTEKTKSKKKQIKREKAVAPHHRAKREGMQEGMAQQSFLQRKNTLEQNLGKSEPKKGQKKKNPK